MIWSRVLFFLAYLVYGIYGFNFLTEFFNDLRFGTIDKQYLKEKLTSVKYKCGKDSFSFNGSCYFISNRKQYNIGLEDAYDTLSQNLMRFAGRRQQQLARSSQVSLIDMPSEAKWRDAVENCKRLNNDSSLFTFGNNLQEYEMIKDLLIKNIFTISSSDQKINQEFEQKYFIGLSFNNSQWKWTDGYNVSQGVIDYFSLAKLKEDQYRKCAYLNIRDDGNVKIELTNCNNEKQPYICKYVIDRCYNNTSCGNNGECVNLLHKKTFECRCRIFYDGSRCEKWSNQGVQMIIASSLVIFAFLFVFISKISSRCISRYRLGKFRLKKNKENNRNYYSSKGIDYDPLMSRKSARFSVLTMETNCLELARKKLKLIILILSSFLVALVVILTITFIRSKIIEARINRYLNTKSSSESESSKSGDSSSNLSSLTMEDIDKNTTSARLTTFLSLDLCRIMNEQFLEDYFIIFASASLTIFIYLWNMLKNCRTHESCCRFNRQASESTLSSTDTDQPDDDSRLRRVCHRIYKCLCLNRLGLGELLCNCDTQMIVPFNPFSKRNRFLTGIIYAAYAYNILKIFEYLLIGDQAIAYANSTAQSAKKYLRNLTTASNLSSLKEAAHITGYPSENGILIDLLKQIVNVLIIGFRYYPVLLCVELKRKSKLCYFLCMVYVVFLLVFYVHMNIFCLLSAYNTVKNAYESIDQREKMTSTWPTIGRLGPARMMLPNGSSLSSVTSSTTLSSVLRNNKTRHLRLVDDKIYSALNKTGDVLTSAKQNLSNELQSINQSLFVSNFMYEKFIFYAVLLLISFNMIYEFCKLMVQTIRRRRARRERAKRKCSCCRKNLAEGSSSSAGDHENDDEDDDDDDEDEYEIGKVAHELEYTQRLLKPDPIKPISFSKYLFEKYVYKSRKDFRFSKQFINTHIIAFILLYYITCIIVRKSTLIVSISSSLLVMVVNVLFRMNAASADGGFMLVTKNQLNSLIISLSQNISIYIVCAACATTAIYMIQLLLGIRHYQRNVINAYRGVYLDIPSPKLFSSTKMTSSSLHYSGYAIGYLLWGYLLLFEVFLVMVIGLRFLIKFNFIAENLAKILLPILTIYLFKRIIIWYICRYFLVNSSSRKTLFLKNKNFYFIINHFNFFFDCFLGSFVCFLRMAKSSMAALFFMPRLDYSIFGRHLERTDLGFISYVTFIHMEVNQTHPIKLAFCELLVRSLKEKTKSRDKTWLKCRNKWAVAYTLMNNPSLKRHRKDYLKLDRLIPHVESFEQFLERHVKVMFSAGDMKKKSKSTPCLVEQLTFNEYEYGTRNSTIQTQPPVAPRRNIQRTTFATGADNYYQNLDY